MKNRMLEYMPNKTHIRQHMINKQHAKVQVHD